MFSVMTSAAAPPVLDSHRRLDAVDRKILAVVQDNASLSVAEIGERVGLSSTPCWKRIQRLESEGIILRRVALVDQNKIGLGITVFVSVESSDHSEAWLTKFAEAVSANTIITWVLRAVGILLLVVGFALFMGPIGVIADVIPFLGSIVRMGTGLVAFLLAVVVGAIVIAVAWFWYRPLLSLGILAGAAVIAFLITRLGKAKQAAAPAQPVGT